LKESNGKFYGIYSSILLVRSTCMSDVLNSMYVECALFYHVDKQT